MKKPRNKKPESVAPSAGLQEESPLLKCEDIQGVLFAYMSRELGDIQSVVIREHILKCSACRAEAAEIEATLALLHEPSGEGPTKVERLSDARRKRILRAVFHPVMDWIDVHHRGVSIVLTVVVLVVTLFMLRGVEVFKRVPLEEGIPIWRIFKSGDLPELVERERRRAAEEGTAPLEDEALPPAGGTHE
jgi:hypothetical protein